MSQLLWMLFPSPKQPYLLEMISPIVGWCETLGHLPTFTNPCQPAAFPSKTPRFLDLMRPERCFTVLVADFGGASRPAEAGFITGGWLSLSTLASGVDGMGPYLPPQNMMGENIFLGNGIMVNGKHIFMGSMMEQWLLVNMMGNGIMVWVNISPQFWFMVLDDCAIAAGGGGGGLAVNRAAASNIGSDPNLAGFQMSGLFSLWWLMGLGLFGGSWFLEVEAPWQDFICICVSASASRSRHDRYIST